MNPVDIILKKRNDIELSTAEIKAFVEGAVSGEFVDYQLAALLMAICINGMTERETVDLTMAMARSGDMLDLSGVSGVTVDKHSTGGVGDTTTLILTPLVACCGAKVAKMSGRGLGHTGGTLDKLESIPGLSVSFAGSRFIRQVNTVGCAVVGQTGNLTPADKVMYALRDVIGAVDSLPLVVSSILSKKIASGASAIVLDVKAGSGAIMPTLEQSIRLAETMVRIGCRTGRRFSAIVTDMDQPLGMYIGNALEVEEAILTLRGEAQGALLSVSLLLGARMLMSAGICDSEREAEARLRLKIENGEGLQKLGDMIEAQGGDRRVVEDTSLLPHAPEKTMLRAARSGYISHIQTDAIGNAAKALGAGREHKDDRIDASVGIVMKVRVGDQVAAGDALCEIHSSPASKLDVARNLIESAIHIGDEPIKAPPLVHKVITEDSAI